MASSGDEMEDLPEFVSNYYFLDDNDEPISFSVLPITWTTTSETTPSRKVQIFMHGYTDEGLQKIMKPVKAWKFDISGEKPEVSVLSKDNNWIKLQKPRKSYEDSVRTVLITVNFLHLVKKNPEMNRKEIWSTLSQIFSLYEDRPSQKDLVEHKALIKEAMKQDQSLTKSKCLLSFMEKRPLKENRADEDESTKEKKEFIVEDGSGEEEDGSGEEEDGSGEEEDVDEEPFDSVCCICDNGGDLLCCEGSCMRSFHATRKAAEEAESQCVSLGFTEMEVKAIPNFKCKNCQYKQHQCFSCGRLGSSDKSLGAEVFQCVNATCGYFYHPHCVAKVLHRGSEAAAKELQDKILAGESFACPLHTCCVCKQPEDKAVPELQMAVCRRCPKAYHAKCLPREIGFEDNDEEGTVERAWRDLLVDRILIYCLKHEILDELGTPKRNHIKFPDDGRKEKQTSASLLMEDNVASKKKRPLVGATSQIGTAIQSKRKTTQDGHSDKKNVKISRLKGPDTSRKSSAEKKSVPSQISRSSRAEEHKDSLGDQLYALYTKSNSVKLGKSDKVSEEELPKTSKLAVKASVPLLDPGSESRILDLMKEASSIITLDDIIVKHDKIIPSREYKQKMDRNKSITHGKVEGSCEAVRAAIRKLDGGGSIEDAKAICEPKVLDQVVKWKGKLRVYLSPFLNGMRYTSWGRHFTKIDKLNEIVDKIHWYVNKGDTVVDFCCGANDFSWLMKKKLDQTGKVCSYKNYDLFRPKNDFSFEKRDWMTVQPRELPPGSQLIMGLNPPFGVRAGLANQFIDQALKFKPKLLILIVPQETERLDKKGLAYDLVWEDFEKLSGKSFYLPGSVDVNDKQMEDWNKVPPVLYLWSRSDWTAKHREIAEKHGHLHGKQENRQICDPSLKIHDQSNDVAMEVDGGTPIDPPVGLKEKSPVSTAEHPEHLENRSVHNDHEGEKHTSDAREDSRASRGSKKRSHHEEKRRKSVETFPERKRRQLSPNNPHHHHGAPHHHSPDNTRDRRPSLENYSARPHHHLPDNTRDRRPSLEDYSARPHHHSPDNTRNHRPSLEDYARHRQGSPLSNVGIRYPGFEPTELPSYSAYGRGDNRINQDSYLHDRIDNYNHHLPPDAFLIGRERWLNDAGSRPSVRPPSYMGEPEYRPSIYSMEPNYSGRSNMPATDRYALRLDEGNRPRMDDSGSSMTFDTGLGGAYNYQAPRLGEPNHPRMGDFGSHITHPPGIGAYGYEPPRPRRTTDHVGFAAAPLNYYSPHGPIGGWISDPPP